MKDESVKNSVEVLPVPAPDLIVVERSAGNWQVRTLSTALAAHLGLDAARAAGRSLDSLLPGAVPSLASLAREAVAGDRSLIDVRVRLPGRSPELWTLNVRPMPMGEDLRGREVAFIFRGLSIAGAEPPVTLFGMVGNSPAIREVFRKIGLYAPTDAAVVITGETGTGKELVARALHDQSLRRDGAFVAVNCSAISGELLESELFGHEKGAFTGALRTHRGRFERADGGTLFLDEIGDMPFVTQAKLLRVLEEGRVERVGSEHGQRVDVRVVAATNVPLEQAVGLGRFRADLYHRLSVLRIHLPPLRERPEDIPYLVDHFLRQFSRKYRRRIYRLTQEAIALLQSYLWPGNIRELRNVLERVFVETQAEVIGGRAFREWIRERRDFAPRRDGEAGSAPMALPYPLDRPSGTGDAKVEASVLEAELCAPPDKGGRSTRPVHLTAGQIRRAYRDAGGNMAEAARRLGVHRATLYRYLHRLGLSRSDL